jgi:hypothetical protein
LAFIIVICDLDIPELQSETAVLLSYSRNFFLQRVLCAVCFCLCLLVLSLPFIDLEVQLLDLLPQLALVLLGGIDILLELIL